MPWMGCLANTYQLTSSKGEVLNEMGDMLSDMFLYFPLFKYEAGSLVSDSNFFVPESNE